MAAGILPSLSCSESIGSVTIPMHTGTKAEFLKSMKLPGSTTSLSLLGAGVRKKTLSLVPVNLYAVGFYVNEEQLKKDKFLAKNLTEGAFEKALRITLAWNITSRFLSLAMKDTLLPRMKKNGDVFADFDRFLKEYDLKKGTAIDFTWIQPSTLHVGISGAKLGPPPAPTRTFESRPLAFALFDLYLEDYDPLSPSLTTSIADGLKHY